MQVCGVATWLQLFSMKQKIIRWLHVKPTNNTQNTQKNGLTILKHFKSRSKIVARTSLSDKFSRERQVLLKRRWIIGFKPTLTKQIEADKLLNSPWDSLYFYLKKPILIQQLGKKIVDSAFFLQKREFMRPIAVLSAEGAITDKTQ